MSGGGTTLDGQGIERDGPERPVIRLAGVSKTYRAIASGPIELLSGLFGKRDKLRPALDTMDLEVARGEALGVVGRNGSGKSTLLRLLAGTLQPNSGHVEIEGRVGALLDLGAGIDPEYTGAENARVLGLLAGLSRREVEERIEAVHAFSGLGEAFDRPVKSYSSGMIMRLGFSAAVNADPEIMLIDEALAVGDAFFQQRCLRRMRELREQGVTIVLVSHDPSAVISLCDRCVWLESGEVLADGTPAEVIKKFLAARYQDDCELDSSRPGRSDLVDPAPAVVVPADGFGVDPGLDRFGDGRARIVGAEVRDSRGAPVSLVHPGETLEIVITARANVSLESVLIGLTLRNRLGDVVTATNTEIEGIRVPPMAAGCLIDVAFRFDWPALTSGTFALSPAIAEGDVAAHNMCDWVENALILECENPTGLFGWLALDQVEVVVGRMRGGDASSPGETAHEVEVDDVEASGSVDRALAPLSASESPASESPASEVHFAFALDEPSTLEVDASRVTEERSLFFSGWCFCVDEPLIEVVIQIGDARPGVARPCTFREDVARVHDAVPHAGRSGFGVLAPLPSAVGPVRCVIQGRLPDGRTRTLAEFDLDLPPSREPYPQPPARASRRKARVSLERPAKILFVSHGLNLEGAPICLLEMASAVNPGRFEAVGWSPVSGALESAWNERGLPIRILPVDSNQGGVDDFEALVRRLAALTSVLRPDLIVANTLDTFWAIHVARELGIPSVWIVHESEEPSSYFHLRLRVAIAAQAGRALSLADRVVFVAQATREIFRDRVEDERCRVIANGLDLERFDLERKPEHRAQVRRRLGLDDGTLLILCVGTTCIRKGQFELVRALAILRETAPDFHCLLLGVVEGDYLDRIRAEIESLDLKACVTLMEPVADPRPYFAAADQALCPSIQESLPRVVQEAMAFGLPVIGTRVFGIPELIRDGQEGLLVDVGDLEGLAAAMRRLAEDPDLAAQMGEAARARIETEFTQRRSIARYESLFDELLLDASEEPVA